MTTHTATTIQNLVTARSLIEEALPDYSPEERLQMIGLMLIGPAHSDSVRPAASKGDQLIEMLKRPQGATLDEVINTFDIKKNSAYARISVETRKRKLKVKHQDGRYHVSA